MFLFLFFIIIIIIFFTAKAEQEKLLSKIADLENELAVEQSKTAEAVIQEREGLQTEITQLKIKVARSKCKCKCLIKESEDRKFSRGLGWLLPSAP